MPFPVYDSRGLKKLTTYWLTELQLQTQNYNYLLYLTSLFHSQARLNE